MSSSDISHYSSDIAIIGMSGRFPGAKNVDEFWQNIRNGVESISFFSDDELRASNVSQEMLNNPAYVKAGASLSDVGYFDASFFGFSPREAEIMDPQHRLFLECAWEALENAGYNSSTYEGAIGIYAGTGLNSYLLFNLLSSPDSIEALDRFQMLIGNDKDHLSTRVSYKLNLRGPSITVQTACSTSLVAVYLACQSVLNEECDIALAGGVALSNFQRIGYLYQEGGILSPDGHCRAFDEQAQGTISGSGAGVVIIKRLADAIADGDSVLAIIKGSALNNDGKTKVGYTAPSVDGQAAVIAEALAIADIAPETVRYIETHGTGTPLGDPVEIAALTKAYGYEPIRTHSCALGSVKTNIGHLDVASGIAGLIKTILALKHKELPPSLHFKKPNPNIDFVHSPFYVNTVLCPWSETDMPRRAGVSSFGIGGTNVHIILEEAPATVPSPENNSSQLLVLSAQSNSALEAMTNNIASYLRKHPDINLADIAYTLQMGRHSFEHRRITVYQKYADLLSILDNRDSRQLIDSTQSTQKKPVVFMFPGQGTQYVQMTFQLYQDEPVFRNTIDYCAEKLISLIGLDLRDLLYPTTDQIEEAQQRLDQTVYTQPALFIVEYALALLWMEIGIRPEAMIGHSIGEYVAACLAGVFSLEDALILVAARGSLMQQIAPGAMLTVALTVEELMPLLDGSISLAAINASSLCVASGPIEDIAILREKLEKKGVECRLLRTSHAFHSQMMDPIIEPFIKKVAKIRLHPPQNSFISNITGKWITEQEATDPTYWAKHLRQTVQFFQGMHEILQLQNAILLEVGPGFTLSSLARQHPGKQSNQIVLNSMRHPHNSKSDEHVFLNAIGQLWLAGLEIMWASIHHGEQRRRLPLPTYPFERQKYWIELNKPEGIDQSGIHTKNDISAWFYYPSWERCNPIAIDRQSIIAEHPLRWLLFNDDYGVGSHLIENLVQAGHYVIKVVQGNHFSKIDDTTYMLRSTNRDDYDALLEDLYIQEVVPQKIVYLWSLTTRDPQESLKSSHLTGHDNFYSILFLSQALGKKFVTDSIAIEFISNNLFQVTGEEMLDPMKSVILGQCRVIPQEYPNIVCRNIDVVLHSINKVEMQKIANQLMLEFTLSSRTVTAYRGKYRWTQKFNHLQLSYDYTKKIPFRNNGVYLITGGMGRIGLILAEFLAKEVRARLILIGRSSFPKRSAWEQWLTNHDSQNAISEKIKKIQAFEKMGAQVLVVSANVADQKQMQEVITTADEYYGQLNGVIHAAGVGGGSTVCPIQEIDVLECERQFQPKINGSLVLAQVLRNRRLDFCLCMSSLSSILGGLGFVAYAAANQFMDTFVHVQNQNNFTPWISVNWDGWRLQGISEQNTPIRAHATELAMTPAEGGDVFRHILSEDSRNQIIISTGDLYLRINQWVKSEPQQQEEVFPRPIHTRPDLQIPFHPPQSKLEQEIATIWQECLGIEHIGIYDNFLELGGHSLIATLIISRLRKSLRLELPLRTFFEAETIADLARAIEKISDQENKYQETPIIPIARKTQNVQKNAQGELQEFKIRPETRIETSEHKDLQFSLFFFSANESYVPQRKYRLLLEGAKYADQNGFTAVWTPERHFHTFGGLYPNPSVTGAALATITENVHIRAGSIVAPLHNPVRVAEEWAVIDNLSNGRIGISFASGWHVNDFVLAPETFNRRKELMFDAIENIQKLWQGESLSIPNGVGNSVDVKISPRPVQHKLPIWLTCASTNTFVTAGRMGANVLTSLLEQDVDVLEEWIKAYREARLKYGHNPKEGHVTLMLHTFLGKDTEWTKAQAKLPYLDYIRTNIELQAIHAKGLGIEVDPQESGKDDVDYLASKKFELLCGQRGLIGTIDTCMPLLNHLRKIGVDEIACLIDFIDDFEVAMSSLHVLNELKMVCNTQTRKLEGSPQ